jgi:hypothetical protein
VVIRIDAERDTTGFKFSNLYLDGLQALEYLGFGGGLGYSFGRHLRAAAERDCAGLSVGEDGGRV